MYSVNRRNGLRHKIWVEAGVYTRKEFFASAVASEISANGIRIETAKAILPDTPVVILLQLPDDEVELRGMVQWTLSSPRQGISLYQMGVKTKALVSEEMKAVNASERSEFVQELLYKISLNEKNHSTNVA